MNRALPTSQSLARALEDTCPPGDTFASQAAAQDLARDLLRQARAGDRLAELVIRRTLDASGAGR